MNTKNQLINCFIASVCFVGSISSASAALIVNPSLAISEVVNVQAIIVSDTDGTNTSGFFGTAGQQSIIEGFIDTIWSQAGIDINFLPANTWNNTFANSGSGTATVARPGSDLNTIVADGVSAGVANSDPNVINMYFVNIAAGFVLKDANSAAGLAFIGSNGITQYVGNSLPGFLGGQEVIAGVVSHEIGHNLGLGHILEFENLMDSSTGQRLNSSQISTALASNFSVAVVPVPPAIILFLSGLGVLGFYRRKRV